MAKNKQSKLLQAFRRQSINILNRPISYLEISPSEIKLLAHLDILKGCLLKPWC